MELTEMDENYLLDTNVLYALYLDNDRLHSKAVEKILELSKIKKSKILLHPLVLIEILSLIKYRSGVESVSLVMKDFDDVRKYLKIDEPIILTKKTYKIFEKYPRIGLIDASLIDYCVKNKVNLVTFDKEMDEVWRKLKTRN